mgnify:CR=1 FL=1
MKSIFLALALIATGVHAAEETDNNPCDAVENDVQTLECSTYSRTTAEDLLKDNYASLNERMQTAYGKNPAQLADITAKLRAHRHLPEEVRQARSLPLAADGARWLTEQLPPAFGATGSLLPSPRNWMFSSFIPTVVNTLATLLARRSDSCWL